jgi:peptide-methionine (S)-S-oxide reductase
MILAGGCFWGVEELFRQEKGIVATRVGYSGGHSINPTYETVKTGRTGHAESIEVTFDSSLTTYENIFQFFFSIHNPTTMNQQGNDRGSQYRSVIFYQNAQEKLAAESVINELKNKKVWPAPIVTELIAYEHFYSAEEYHQDYLQKNPDGYTCHFQRYKP